MASAAHHCPTTEALPPPNQSTNWLVFGLFLGVLALFGWIMVRRLADCPKGIQADFVQEWTSAKNYLGGHPVYEPLAASFQRYFQAPAPQGLTVNAHPPGAVLLAIPLGAFEYRRAWLGWNLFSLALLAGSIWLLFRGLQLPPRNALPVAALLLASNPLAQQVIEGQMNLLLLALLTGAWTADRRQRPFTAGALIGLAAAVKLYPAFAVVYFIARRQWTAVFGSVVGFAAVSTMSLVLLGPDVFLIYGRDVLPSFQHFGSNLANASLPGLWQKAWVGIPGQSTPIVFAPLAARICSLVSGLLLAGICGWRAAGAGDRREQDLAFAACILGMLLASPITWGHSFVLLTLPVLIAWRYAPPRSATRATLIAMVLLLGVVRQGWIWNPAVPGFEAMTLGLAPADYRVQPFHTVTVLSYSTWALLAIFGILVCQPASRTAAIHRS